MAEQAGAWRTPASPVGLLESGDVAALAQYGAELLAQVEALAPATNTPAAAKQLVDEMDGLQLAMQARAPARIRRRVGLLGRLLGRDVELQDQAQRLEGQLDVSLLRADAAAAALREATSLHLDSAARMQGAAEAIGRCADAGQATLAQAASVDGRVPSDAQAVLSRRVHHLRGLAQLRQLDAGQFQLLHAQGVELLERYRRIREVLVPLLRQRSLAHQAAGASEQVMRAGEAQAAIAAEVAAMQARLR